MKTILLSVFFLTFICFSAYSQKPYYKMTDTEISKIPVEQVKNKVITEWDDILLNVYCGMKYPNEVVFAFAMGFEKGMEKWKNNLPSGKTTNKQKAVFKAIEDVYYYSKKSRNFPEAIALMYQNIDKKNIEEALLSKRKLIENSTNLRSVIE